VAERDWGFEVGVTTSSGPSDVMSEIAGDDHELQSRWLVGAQVWGGGVYIPLVNNRCEQLSKKANCQKELCTKEGRLPERGLMEAPGPRGAGGDKGRRERERASQGKERNPTRETWRCNRPNE